MGKLMCIVVKLIVVKIEFISKNKKLCHQNL